MNQTEIEAQVLGVLRSVLGPDAGSALGPRSALLGSVAELDSMAVVSILTSLEERFGIDVADDEVDGTTFETVARLCDFVGRKLAE